jgi:PhzF family phenazine biosynthesis protein
MRPFQQVDVFTDVAYLGNPLGVVLDGSALTTEQMQQFTDWTNLSECTFLLPPSTPEADYRVRIFCPGRELIFAGHPTLGSCHAWLRAGGTPSARPGVIVQECGAGLVPIRRDATSGRLAFGAPPLVRSGPLSDTELDEIAAGLRIGRDEIIDHGWLDNGPNWRGVLLASAEQVLRLNPDPQLLARLDLGVIGLHHGAGPGEPAVEIRAFFPGNSGLTEDPVTGSLNAAVAMWLIGNGTLPASYVAAQGTAIGRRGRIHVDYDGETFWIAGHSVTCIEGTVTI